MVDSAKYAESIAGINLKWTFPIPVRVSNLRGCHFKPDSFDTTGWNKIQSGILYSFSFWSRLDCSFVIFEGLLEKDLQILRRGLSLISLVYLIQLRELSFKLCDQCLFTCKTFADKLLTDPTHLPPDDIARCHSHIFMRLGFRSIPLKIDTHETSTVPYLAYFLTNSDLVSAGFLNNLFWVFKPFTWRAFSNTISVTVFFIMGFVWKVTFMYANDYTIR